MPFDTSGTGPGEYQPPEGPTTVPQDDPPVIPQPELPGAAEGEEYIILMKLTEAGAQQAEQPNTRLHELSGLVQILGGQVRFCYATRGPYDLVAGVSLPDSASAFGLVTGLLERGLVTPTTMNAMSLPTTLFDPHVINHPH